MLISELGGSQSMAQQAEANEKHFEREQNAPMPELQSADAGAKRSGSVLDRTSKDGRSTDTEIAAVIARGGSSTNQPARVPYCISHFTCIVTTFDLL